MRLGSLALAGLVLFGGAVWAATGDPLVVTGDGVNVRSEPSTDSRILMQVYRDRQVIELERQGAWVRAEIAGTDGLEGWIHGSLLAPPEGATLATPPAAEPEPEPETAAAPREPAAQPPDTTATVTPEVTREEPSGPLAATPSASTDGDLGAAPEPAAGPAASQLGGLAQFRESVDYLNQRAQDLAGVDLFADIEVAGEGVVQVVTAEGWSTVTPAGQKSFLNTLAARWAAAQGGGPASVQIVDPDGRVVMEKTGP